MAIAPAKCTNKSLSKHEPVVRGWCVEKQPLVTHCNTKLHAVYLVCITMKCLGFMRSSSHDRHYHFMGRTFQRFPFSGTIASLTETLPASYPGGLRGQVGGHMGHPQGHRGHSGGQGHRACPEARSGVAAGPSRAKRRERSPSPPPPAYV